MSNTQAERVEGLMPAPGVRCIDEYKRVYTTFALGHEDAPCYSDSAVRAAITSLVAENEALRCMLCLERTSGLAYTDDGEMQDNSLCPAIDYLRDPLSLINRKLQQRAARNTTQQQGG